MTDEAALRAAVLAHPDDDTPRLVYADWCDDAGDADRAAFIRAQVEAARAEPWSPAQRDAAARAAARLPRYVHEWAAEPHRDGRTPEFRRGFVEGVGAYLEDLNPDSPRFADWRRRQPIHRLAIGPSFMSIAFYWAIEEFLGGQGAAGLTALDLAGSDIESPPEFECLTDAPVLATLTELRLGGRPVPPEWLTRFLSGPKLPALAALDLADIPNLGPALALGLAAAHHRAFTKLNFTGVRFLSRELKRVLESPAVAAVEELRLGWTYPGPGPATMIDLGWLLPWNRLRLLDLAGQQLGPDGVREITTRPEAAALRWLGLARNHLGDSGARRLVESPHLHLYHLDVTGNDIAPPLLAALRARFPEAVVVG